MSIPTSLIVVLLVAAWLAVLVPIFAKRREQVPETEMDGGTFRVLRRASASIRRRRVCPDCGGRFTTFERVQLRELTVVKRSGKRVPFDRDKLSRSVAVALRKRSVEPERVERLINGIVRQLESSGEGEVGSEAIGELVMEGLKRLDGVAYVRFASVYKNFREARDFEELIGRLTEEKAGADEALACAKPDPV